MEKQEQTEAQTEAQTEEQTEARTGDVVFESYSASANQPGVPSSEAHYCNLIRDDDGPRPFSAENEDEADEENPEPM